MFFRLLTSAVTLVVCSTALAQAPLVSPAISYTRDIQPILTEKCVACHACNDAACQLNLGSAEGATRGASKVPVYKGDRVDAVAPTRIFYDASGPNEWRNKGFYSVLDAQGAQAALMARMLELGHSTPLTPNAKLPEEIVLGLNRENVCPAPGEFNAYAQSHPKEGMPLAVTGLTDQQYSTVQTWLAQGAKVDQNAIKPTAVEAAQIAEWEELFNRPGSTEALVARWYWRVLACRGSRRS